MTRWRPPARRFRAERYLTLILLSFTLSVMVTRLFLYVTGYPRLATGILHVAHVLWGGLLLWSAVVIVVGREQGGFRLAALQALLLLGVWHYQRCYLNPTAERRKRLAERRQA